MATQKTHKDAKGMADHLESMTKRLYTKDKTKKNKPLVKRSKIPGANLYLKKGK